MALVENLQKFIAAKIGRRGAVQEDCSSNRATVPSAETLTSDPQREPASDLLAGACRRAAMCVSELLMLHDEMFVQCAYLTLLKREPDPAGLAYFLSRVRAGESREWLLAEIHLSVEGQAAGVNLPGLDHAIRRYVWRGWPVVGAALRLAGQPDRNHVHRRLRVLESRVAKLSADIARRSDEAQARIAWITTWNVKCGIATYSEHLTRELDQRQVFMFAARNEDEPLTRIDKPNCRRIWTLSKHRNGFDVIEFEMERQRINCVVVQFNYGFFNHEELRHFIERCLANSIPVFIDFHATIDPFGDVPNYRIVDLMPALAKCRVLVHGEVDRARLAAMGLTNVSVFPLGVLSFGDGRLSMSPRAEPVLASFGFCLPHKGLKEIIEAVELLRQNGRRVKLRLYNAEYPNPASGSKELVLKLRQMIDERGLTNDVTLETSFYDDETCIALLADADLILYAYQNTTESASAAVRYGIAAGVPVAVTPLPIFDDLGDAVFRLPGISPHQIAEGVTSTLDHLAAGTGLATKVRAASRQWRRERDFAVLSRRLLAECEAEIRKTQSI